MTGSELDFNTPSPIHDQLAASAAAERRLLKQERKAERLLEEAQTNLAGDRRRLAQAQDRVERRLRAVAEAVGELRACQTRRAVGPLPAED